MGLGNRIEEFEELGLFYLVKTLRFGAWMREREKDSSAKFSCNAIWWRERESARSFSTLKNITIKEEECDLLNFISTTFLPIS